MTRARSRYSQYLSHIQKNKKKKTKDWSLNVKIMAMFLWATLVALLPTLLMYYIWLLINVLWISILYVPPPC